MSEMAGGKPGQCEDHRVGPTCGHCPSGTYLSRLGFSRSNVFLEESKSGSLENTHCQKTHVHRFELLPSSLFWAPINVRQGLAINTLQTVRTDLTNTINNPGVVLFVPFWAVACKRDAKFCVLPDIFRVIIW